MRALWIVLVLLLVGCAHSRANEEHATASSSVSEVQERQELATERVEDGPSETVRMEGEWFTPPTSGPQDVGEVEKLAPGRPAASPAAAPAVRRAVPAGLVFRGSIEVKRTGPHVEERSASSTEAAVRLEDKQEEKAAKASSETQLGPPPWVWALAWVVGGLVVAGLGALALRRVLP